MSWFNAGKSKVISYGIKEKVIAIPRLDILLVKDKTSPTGISKTKCKFSVCETRFQTQFEWMVLAFGLPS